MNRTVRVVCTDRGQHPRRRLADLIDHRQAPLVDEMGHEWSGFLRSGDRLAGRNKTSGVDDYGRPLMDMSIDVPHGNGRSFGCKTCGRNPQMSLETLGRIVDALASPDTPDVSVTVDISALPF